MAYKNSMINWNQLIQFTKNGIVIANYNDIRSAITRRFKEIYGEDIDLATTSADGIYVETLCLIVSNILQSFKQYYAQLDVRTASGQFLDVLCALSNVYRKSESNSTAQVELTLDENATDNYTTNRIDLLDKNGNIWSYNDLTELVFEPCKAQEITVVCEKPGPVRADVGWIDRLVENNVVMSVRQLSAAAIGSYAESDSELRARRNASLGATGSTVLETMVGALYTINGIKDVKIYNNDSTQDIVALDGTKINTHDIYVILRQQPNIIINDSTICSTIYERLTPGIRTTKSNGVNGTAKQFRYLTSIAGIPADASIVQNVYWKIAKPIKPKITIELKVTTNYASKNNAASNLIAENAINYLNSLPLSTTMLLNDLWNVVYYSDNQFRGQPTFTITSITVDGQVVENNNNVFKLPDTYFDYSIETDVQIKDPHNDSSVGSDLSVVTIILGGN